MMLKLWKWYQSCLANHPVKTQIISSGILWGAGDIAAQSITHSTIKKRLPNPDDAEPFKIDWKRVGITSSFGFGFVGTIGHFWYEGLDKLIRKRAHPGSLRFIAAKVALDGIIFGPVDLLAFFTYLGICSGKSIDQVKKDIKRDFLPALAVQGGAWPLLQIANFKYVPVRYQLLYVNVFCLVDSAFLSWVEQQHDAAWKQWFTSLLDSHKKEKEALMDSEEKEVQG